MHPILSTRFCERFGVRYPIIQAGMAGGITSPEMVAAVAEAGGLGTFSGGYMQPEALRQAIRRIKALTDRPYAVNLLLYGPAERAEVSPAYRNWLNQQREAVGLPAWTGELPQGDDPIEACFQVMVEEEVPIFSFAFSLPGAYAERARQAGMKLIGTATTLAEALALAEAGVDAIVAQGGEAGGHRGTFDPGPQGDGACVGTMVLVPLLADALPEIPVIAAGGIIDGRGLIAALALGADGVQLGTRFLASRESLVHPAFKARVLAASETDTVVTRAISGRPARGIQNRLIRSLTEHGVEPLPYPLQNSLTREIRAAAQQAGENEYMAMLAGQGVAMVREAEGAAEIIGRIVREAEHTWERLSAGHDRN